ncbi:PAS domain S-box protein [Natronorubrum sp. JWXQ-INN-674]|uniref:histidine kinase n=1 Tax=Natronorubrum halalkaliphilum TaxID=2691917 RepID=A0A6B0VQD0_9EURY|nr:PAS domain S-box protein [Natronorubrum halalkaliphilum]MXV64041.1 PAS domain S-box protein [Natronorubrum halalkaliphilum]
MSSRADATGEVFWGNTDEKVALQRYQTLITTIDDGIYQLDADGHFVAVNEGFLEATGYDRDELLGEHISLVLADDDLTEIRREIRTQLKAGADDVVRFELGIHTAGGEIAPCELRINLLVNEDEGEFEGTIGVVRELSERTQRLDTFESARASTDSITNVLDEANIGVFVLDQEFDVAWIDATIGDYFDLDRREVIGRDKRQILNQAVKHKFDNPDQFADTVLSTYEDNSYVERFECRMPGDDDHEERWLEHYSKPIESGQYAGGRIELYYDITDRKRSEGVLRETEERFRSLADAVEEYAIFRLDADGDVISWNEGAREIKGYDAEAILGEHFSTFYTSSDRAAGVPERNLERATANGSVEDEGWRVRNDGTRFWANVTITAVFDDDGTHRGYLKVTRDMTDRYEREQELESELQRIFGRISDAFYALDEDCRFTHVNDRAEQILGLEREEVLGTCVWTTLPELEGTPFEKRYREAMETQESNSFEAYYPPIDTWLEVNVYPSETGLSVYFRDITERKERERELRRKERRFEAIFNDPNILVGLLEPDGTTLDINQTAMEYIHADLEDVTGVPFWETPWWGEGDGVQSDVKRWTQRAADGEYVEFETDLTRPNGEQYTLDGVFRPVTNDEGDVVSIIVSDRDVTERREYERQLSTLMDNVPGMVYRCHNDREWQMEFVSDACREITGYEPDALETGAVSYGGDIMVEDDREEVWEEIQRTVDDGETFSLTYRIETADGDLRWVRSEGRGHFDDGTLVTLEGIISDITERKRLETELKESNERLEQFAYAASHDLQEPLRMVTSYLQLIERRYADALDEDGTEFIEFAVDGADRMREMIDGLLEYSRVETRGDPFEPIEMDAVLNSAVEDLQLQIQESNAEITNAELPTVKGDDSQLRQVFQNLLSNAITYSGEDPPHIHIDAEQRGREWVFSVHDDGIGIPPEDQDRIFTVFDRLHSNEEYEGAGIGLALCERIVERHDGEIWVESEPGNGSTFSFTLPAAE